jgi:hypothetical protein
MPGCSACWAAMGTSEFASATIWAQTCSEPGTAPERTICWQAAIMESTAALIGAIPETKDCKKPGGWALASPLPPAAGAAGKCKGGSGD